METSNIIDNIKFINFPSPLEGNWLTSYIRQLKSKNHTFKPIRLIDNNEFVIRFYNN